MPEAEKAAPKANVKDMSWAERVTVALKKCGGTARLSQIAQACPLPKGWNPEKHKGSNIEGQGESIESRVWSTLQRMEAVKKVKPGTYRLVLTVKKAQHFKVGEKKVPAEKKA